jgi:hypothetical protein
MTEEEAAIITLLEEAGVEEATIALMLLLIGTFTGIWEKCIRLLDKEVLLQLYSVRVSVT